jgi:RNA-directed DNA polymerase
MSKAKRQMPERAGRVVGGHGEAVRDPISDEARDPLAEHLDTESAKLKAGTAGLLEAALTRENLQAAWKRVKANKGAARVGGLDIKHTVQMVRTHWSRIGRQLLGGTYRPSPVRKVIPTQASRFHVNKSALP